MSRLLTLLLIAASCRRDDSEGPPAPVGDDDDDDDTATDTGAPTDEPPESLALTQVAATLDDDVGTVVVVSWEQSAAATVHLEYSFDEGVWLSSPERSLDAGAHEELLLGIPYDTDTTFRVVAVDPVGTVASPDTVVRTTIPPDNLPAPVVLSSDPDGMDPARPYTLVSVTTFNYGDWTEIVDAQGRVVWAKPAPPDRATLYPRLSVAEDALLIDHNSVFALFDGGALATVVETKIDGSITHTWATPGAHHPFTGMPDGSIAYARHYGDDYAEDITVVARDGTATPVFDCTAWALGLEPDGSCGANTLKVHEPSGHLFLTLYTLQTTVEVDPATGDAVRWFGNLPGSWAFDPARPNYPHGTHLTDAGTLLMSDSSQPFGTGQMMVREFSLDDATETATEIWSFGLGQGIEGYGFGDAERLPNGNTVQNCGVARLREVTPAGEVVRDLEWVHPFYPFMQIGHSASIADLYALAPERP